MKVILNKDISNLGEEGEIRDVARGYARNYLIPNNLVMPYTREALSILESRRERLGQRREEKRKAALDVKTRIETEDLVLEMPAGERGRLFGSVTSATITDALAAQGISVERKRLEIPEKTIKTLGTTRVKVRLYGDEEAELKVIVTAAGGKTETGESSSDTASPAPAAETESLSADTPAEPSAADTDAEAEAMEDVDAPEAEAATHSDTDASDADEADEADEAEEADSEE